jgi:uncharacterized membrane protein YeaQ/YmgE (transglycosylase-associated protein family)
MLRIILGIIVGFIAWSIIWVGSDQFLASISRDWYGAHQDKVALAVVNGESFNPDFTIVLISLVRSIIASIMAGFLAAVVAGENRRSPLILGVILLAVGIAVQVHLWNVFPVWFHVVFWALLIPMTILGGKLKQSS